MSLNVKLRQYTDDLNRKGLLRKRVVSQPRDSSIVSFDSNDYLSLLGDSRIAQAYEEGYKRYGSGSGASMLLSGYHANHHALEQAFAQLLGVDNCVLFSSGYAANLALSTLLGKIGAHCVIDKSIHASLYDGLNLSQAQYSRFLHNDLASLTQKLMQVPDNAAVITEGLFSMSGQIAPLNLMSQLLSPQFIPLFVDEAHSIGVLGNEGRGAICLHQLSQKEVPLRVLAFGKAFAAQGALIAGQGEWIEALIQASRSLIYSTAVSPALSYGLLKTLDIVVAAEIEGRSLLDSFFILKIKH